MRPFASFLLLAGCAATEWTRDYDGDVPGASPPSVYAAMVVDATTGAPLPGASLRLYQEDTRPTGMAAALVLEAVADEFGVVAFPWRDDYKGCHFVFDAEGYGATCEFGPPGERVELWPGRACRGQLFDGRGAPAAGITVEYFFGCPHSPALRRAKTDASGWFEMKDIGKLGFLWAPAPGAAAHVCSPLALPVPGTVLEPIVPGPGVTVTGTAYDAKGQPAAGAVVYSTQDERGPKVVTAADGTFALVGVEPGAEIGVGPPAARARIRRPKPADTPPPAPPRSSIVRVHPPGDVTKFLDFWIHEEERAEPDARGEVELRTTLAGPVQVSFAHEEYGDGSLVVDVNAPEVEVPPEAFPNPRALRAPLDTVIELWDAEEGWWPNGPGNSIPEAWAYQPGVRVRLERDGQATNYRVLEGPGPYALEPGRATVELLVDASDAICWADGECFRGLVVHGLDAGSHTLLVGAPGRRAKAMRVVLADGETRRIEVRLDPR